MIINKPHLVTHMQVWHPKYSTKHGDYKEPVALLHKKKVDFATHYIIVEFPKAKGLQGQRFAILKQFAQSHNLTTNGRAEMYEVPMSHFDNWISGKEVYQEIEEIGWN